MRKSRLKAVNHQLNALYAPVDRLFAPTGEPSCPDPVFIVSPPRSGSTLLYQVILNHFPLGYLSNAHQYCYGAARLLAFLENRYRDKPLPYASRYGRIEGLFSPTEYYGIWYRLFKDSIDGGVVADFASLDSRRVEATRTLVANLATIKKSPLLIKCLYLDLCLAALARVFPGSRFIRIERDELETAYSIYTKLEKLPAAQRSTWSIGYPDRERYDTQDPAIQASAQVIRLAEILASQCRQLDTGRLLEIDYRELCLTPATVIERLAAFLNLAPAAPCLEGISYSERAVPRQFKEQFNQARELLGSNEGGGRRPA
jgi:hypothetical protein